MASSTQTPEAAPMKAPSTPTRTKSASAPTTPAKSTPAKSTTTTPSKSTPAKAKPAPASPRRMSGGAFDAMHESKLVSCKTWDVYSPPPRNSVKGILMPKVISRHHHRRKISIEVHKITPIVDKKNKKDEASLHSYDECVVRLLVPSNKSVERLAEKKAEEIRKHGGSTYARSKLGDGSSVAESALTADDEDDTSVVHEDLKDIGGVSFDGWKAKYRIPLDSIKVLRLHKKDVLVAVQVQNAQEEREFIFDSTEEAKMFGDALRKEKESEKQRSEARLKAVIGDLDVSPAESLSLLVEIVSGWDLPIGDFTTSDPYVVCSLGKKEIHKTKHISQTLNPIWTIKTSSLFIMELDSRTLFLSEGMTCLVKDYDRVGHNEPLGVVIVPPEDLYNGNGERKEYKLSPPPGSRDDEVPGYLAIRVRRASPNDIRFMEGYKKSLKAASATEHPESKTSNIKSIITRKERTEKNGTKVFKVRPYPDPKREKETDWMTHDAILQECMKASQHWVDAGSGKIGRIFLEVLGCDKLPNLDAGGMLGNKTDAFVAVVFEDTYNRTDTIDDCLSPRWMPWCQRAFILNRHHPSSQILIGVFDFDAGIDDHDLIGRISVDVSNLRHNTEYVLSYSIYPSARITGREQNGQITLRLRLEADDERKIALSALEPPTATYINVKKRKDFNVVRSTCVGKYDYEKYSISTIKSYVDELREYQNILFHIQDAVMTLFLWRGHFPVRFGKKKFVLPLHSMNAFLVAIILVENPQYIPSFWCLFIAWILIAVVDWRNKTANVWARSLSYQDIAESLVLGKSRHPPVTIEPNQDWEDVKKEKEAWANRLKEAEKAAALRYEQAQKEEAERLKELEEIGEANTDISTKVGGKISIDPIRAALYPVQLILGLFCEKLRFVRHVVIWQECYFAFWISTGCIVLAVAGLFVPWFFIIRWTARIIVWTIFGPLMKLVDVYYVSVQNPETEEERKRREQEERLKRKLMTSAAASQVRITRENTAKLKDMKKYMFGKFACKIPILKEDRYIDEPLPGSSATPYAEKSLSLAELAMQEAGYRRTRAPGQNLVGDMIPVIESTSPTTAPVGKATSRPEKLTKGTPGSEKKGSDSTVAAYVKIGSAVVVAGVVTWFGVPVLSSVTEKALQSI